MSAARPSGTATSPPKGEPAPQPPPQPSSSGLPGLAGSGCGVERPLAAPLPPRQPPKAGPLSGLGGGSLERLLPSAAPRPRPPRGVSGASGGGGSAGAAGHASPVTYCTARRHAPPKPHTGVVTVGRRRGVGRTVVGVGVGLRRGGLRG
jgi:hypothetical protein